MNSNWQDLNDKVAAAGKTKRGKRVFQALLLLAFCVGIYFGFFQGQKYF
jgi:hypothetical protein